MDIWTGFIIGFFGSFHCIGMCGPIALALPVTSDSTFIVALSRFLYNIGRVITYSFFGFLFGLFGRNLELVGVQQYMTIGFGVIIIVYVLLPQKYKLFFSQTRFYQFSLGKFREIFSKIIQRKSVASFLAIGILNGFLPCGFVYVGIAGAITTGSAVSGAIYMALFGLGTIPIMFAASMITKFFGGKIRSKINKMLPVLALVLALLFIIRGLGLGIPYLSPPAEKLRHMEMKMDH